LYRGDFLAGFTLKDSAAFDEWQFFESENLRRALADVLERLVRYHILLEAFQAAIPYAQRWLSLDLLHEPAHRELMRLYHWSGQRAAALRQYQQCVAILHNELGVEPEQETTALNHLILTSQKSVPTSPGEIPRPPRRCHALFTSRPSTPFIGRERERAEIARLLDDPACRQTVVGTGGRPGWRSRSRRRLLAPADGVYFVRSPRGFSEFVVPATPMRELRGARG
jgi:tetratricopeptide (TPR) repeat protein